MNTTVSILSFLKAHGRSPRGYGLWIFVSRDGEEIQLTGTYETVRGQLPAGHWAVQS